jgi:hypothetical protein
MQHSELNYWFANEQYSKTAMRKKRIMLALKSKALLNLIRAAVIIGLIAANMLAIK